MTLTSRNVSSSQPTQGVCAGPGYLEDSRTSVDVTGRGSGIQNSPAFTLLLVSKHVQFLIQSHNKWMGFPVYPRPLEKHADCLSCPVGHQLAVLRAGPSLGSTALLRHENQKHSAK